MDYPKKPTTALWKRKTKSTRTALENMGYLLPKFSERCSCNYKLELCYFISHMILRCYHISHLSKSGERAFIGMKLHPFFKVT